MKIKPLYIYLIGFVLFVGVIIFFSTNKEKAGMPDDAAHSGMPQDDIHKGMGGMEGMGAMSEAFKKRETELKGALEKNPADTLKMREYAEFLMAAHKPVESLKYLLQIVEKDPKRIDILLNITFIYDIQGNVSEAEATTRKILAIDNNNQPANFNLGVLMDKKGDKEKAKQIWNDLIKKYPNSDIAKLSKEALDGMNKK